MKNKFATPAGVTSSFLEEMMLLKDVRSRRASSWDRTGGNSDAITVNASETATLADIQSAGCIRHIYFTTNHPDRFYMRKAILRMFWDDEKTPSVEVPLGDFFGLGFCETRFFKSLLVTVNPGSMPAQSNGALIGLNSYFPMPFSKRALITLENDSEAPFGAVWYHIDYEECDSLPDNLGRFHAQWRRESPCTAVKLRDGKNLDGKENYVILEAKGEGNYAGMFLNVDNICGGWYGEGDDMIFIDGEKWPPSLHGTGTEEIFGGGACPNVEYAGPYTGFHLVSSKDFAGKQSMYRFHVTDPVRFRKSIRVTLEHGHANDLGNDYSSTAFWYQAEPHGKFPRLLKWKDRLPRCDDELMTVYRKELETYSVIARMGGVYAFLETVSEEDKAQIQKHSSAVNEEIQKKDYDAALKSVGAIHEVLKKYDR